MYLVVGFLMNLLLMQVQGNYFCAQFRPFLRMTVPEDAAIGAVVGKTLTSSNNQTYMRIKTGDKAYIRYDINTGNVLTKADIGHYRGKTLKLKGMCNEHIVDLNHTIMIDGVITVDVIDLNDPPQIRNLPTTVYIGESTPKGDVVYVIKADNPNDVDPFFSMNIFTVLNVTGSDRSESLDAMFTTDRLGRLKVIADLDYENGHREFFVTVQVKDAGSPPLSTVSHLHVVVNDSDDQAPRFRDKIYTASVIGEKPVVEECQATTPPLFAEDQDPVVKSSVRYHIKDGVPVEPWHWQNFFFLETETGYLCQRETIPRSVHKRGDQTVRDLIPGFMNYTLTVESYQIDNRSKSDTAILHVHVIDQNAHSPEFTRGRYKAVIEEYPAVRAATLVTIVRAEDEDYGKNSLFEYEILNNPSGAFWIDSSSGEVKVNRPFSIDREKNETIIFKVRATETSTNERKHSEPDAIIQVTVLDVNDNKPVFKKPVYRFTAKDSLTVGTSVHRYGERIQATDADLNENGTVHFSVIGVQTKGGSYSVKDLHRFQIDPESGVLKLADSLRDLRRKRKFPQYIIMVKAEDQADDPRNRLSSVVRATVQIVEANDFPPYFENEMPTSYISEAATIGSLITKVKARDEDGDEDVFLKFRIIAGNNKKHFRISDAGYVSTNRPLDREDTDQYTLTVEASDGKHTAEAKLTIHVRDANDHSPVFGQSTYQFSLAENARANQDIGNVHVTDKDEGPNGKIVYSLIGEHSDLFGIRKSGGIYLKRRDAAIDRETTERITLRVRAEDLGQPPQQGEATVRIDLQDVNDNRPVFTKDHYGVTIIEETPGKNRRNKPIVMEEDIQAEDADADRGNRDIVYTLKGQGSDVFKINERSGRLFIKDTRRVDCEVKCKYDLKVIARDQGGSGLEGRSDLSIFVQDINDMTPQLVRNYTFTASSQARPGSVVGDIDAVDRDVDPRNKRVMYILRDGGYGKFRVDFDSGNIIVVDSLNREPQMAEYNLTIEVMDTGEPRLSSKWIVKVKVPINASPVLDADQQIEVREDVRSGVKIGKVKVTDNGDVLTYRIVDGDKVPFRVSSDGSIRTNRRLNRETTESYTLKVMVTDRGVPVNTVTATIAIHVEDVNDHAPAFTFSRYSGEIVEDDQRPLKDQIVHMSGEISATDKDGSEENRAVVLSLRGKDSDKFAIDSETGVVRVVTPGSIDCEIKCYYSLQIHAQDRNGTGLTGTASLLISVKDLNDHTPQFEHNVTINLDSLTKPGSKVGKAKATDKDKKSPNNAMLLVLTEGGQGKFEVDPYTGEIRLVSSLLEEPRQEEYLLRVKAFDFGNPSRSSNTTITLNVPLNFAPELPLETALSVREGVPVGTDVDQLVAQDVNIERGEKDTLKFFLGKSTLEDDAFPFIINPTSGMITTRKALDKEVTDEYKFVVYVEDSLLPVYTSSTSVHITVQDQNDSPPQFTSPEYIATLQEDSFGEHALVKIIPSISVSDEDTPLDDIVYGLAGEGSELFEIDPATSSLRPKPDTILDSETQQIYNLTLTASDGSFSTEAAMTVSIEDVNDHSPSFIGEITLNVSSSTPENSVIGHVEATDGDATERNSGIMYYIMKGGLDKFIVHPHTGDIQTIASLTEEPNADHYVLTVRATDLGVPQLHADTTVTVYVPINYRPHVPPVTQSDVAENATLGSAIAIIDAVDRNIQEGDGDKLVFLIEGPFSKEFPFHVDKDTGNVTIVQALDRETQDKYTFVVTVSDSRQPVQTSSTSVVISVQDVNDNPPVFSTNQYMASVKEDDANPGAPQEVYLRPSLSVTDADDDSGSLEYSLHGDGNHLFSIDSHTGRIIQSKAGNLDAETKSEFNLLLQATDGIHTSESSLHIAIDDVNDHTPVFNKNISIHIDPFTIPGTEVADASATDGDYGEWNKAVRYFLLGGGLDKFAINEKTGKITLLTSLLNEPKRGRYNLQVRAIDMGTPQQFTEGIITIRVPINFKPELQPTYTFNVLENVTVGSQFGMINATDRNTEEGEDDKLNYFIDEPSTKGVDFPFMVERNTGRLVVSCVLDREKEDHYSFHVFVSDSRKPVYTSSTVVYVTIGDVNDSPPVFSAPLYTARIMEDDGNTGSRQKLSILPDVSASDPDEDSNALEYTLRGAGSDLFKINSNTATITQTQPGTLDSDSQQFLNLTLVATDGTHESTSQLHINIEDTNDNAPMLSTSFNVTLDPSERSGTVIARVEAVDADVSPGNGDVAFYLQSGGLDKFSVDSNSGDIVLEGDLLEPPYRDEYRLKIRAVDFGQPQLSDETTVTVHVTLNHAPVVSAESVYRVDEDVPVGTHIGRVDVIDPDRNDTSHLTFLQTDQDVPFAVNDGIISLRTKLDSEKTDVYKFPILIFDAGSPTHTVTTLSTVYIDGVNDESPVFSHTMYTAVVEEKISPEDSLKPIAITPELSVHDGDGDDVVLNLEGEGSDLFSIDSNTLQLTVVDPTLIDCEVACQYDLHLIATDDGERRLQSFANLTISINDVNDHAPVFDHAYNLTVLPDVAIGTVVGVVEARDSDGSHANSRVTYLLTSGGAGKFFIDPTSGEILVTESLIAPPIHEVYKLNIQARDSGFPTLYNTTVVTIDVPVNKPPSVPDTLTLTIPESTAIGGQVGIVPVTDPDAVAEYPVVYSLLDHTEKFSIHPTSGIITTKIKLNAEDKAGYVTLVQVEDHGLPTYVMTSSVTINIADVNDNYPEFSSPAGYSAVISEIDYSETILNLIPTFSVSDADKDDGELHFKLIGDGADHFTIDPALGKITVAPDVDIDCEAKCHYDLKISATDQDGLGLSSLTSLQIYVDDVNDNPPDVTPDLVFDVKPEASIGDVIGRVIALDHDNSTKNNQLSYLLTEGGFGKFAVDFNSGIITVADKLSREPVQNRYPLTITVRDSGQPTLTSEAYYTVNVPLNHAPVFKPSTMDVSVSEDVEIGHILADMAVEDPDSLEGGYSNVTYQLFGHQGLFSIDETGLITTMSKLDAEHSKVVDMTATVVDRGIPDFTGTTAVHVDITGVNDNIPTFSSLSGYTVNVREDVGLSSILPVELVLSPGLTVEDDDGDDVELSLSGDGAHMFDIDKNTNTITLREPDKIDCEQNCRYNLSIMAQDSGSPPSSSSTNLTVNIEDVNEHAPEFAKTYVFPVPVASKPGTLVGYVKAVDKDYENKNNDVSYSLVSGGYDKFAVHSTSGAITVTDSLIREPHLEQYQLLVEARDKGYPQKSRETKVLIEVPVNKYPSLPTSMVFNITEDFAVGEKVTTIRANDVDLNKSEGQYLEYSLIGGEGVFSIDRRLGDLILFEELDAEVKNLYELTVRVEDHGYPSLTSQETITVSITDVNDHPPVFTSTKGYVARIPENTDLTVTPTVEIVPELSALDGDVTGAPDDIRYSLKGLGSEAFVLDDVTGKLSLSGRITLDADVQQFYNLTITATDDKGLGQSSETGLNITIEDINDIAPVFTIPDGMVFPIIVDPILPIGSLVYTLTAEDGDADEANNRITFVLHNGGYGKFSVDAVSGDIKIADDLTREPLEKNYYLNVKALDSGSPQLSAETTISLHVPLNTKPVPQTDIQISVAENVTLGETIGHIYVKDFDGQNGGLEFFLNNDVFDFTIDRQRGDIRTVRYLDAELKSEYELGITIVDHGYPTHTVTTTATVRVEDIDDNLPRFSALTQYTASLQEGAYSELQEITLLPGLSVSDDDITMGNSEYKVYLKGRGSQLFQITPDGSHIMLKDASVLDAENETHFDLEIVAENAHDETRWSSHNLTINVKDKNDHAPSLPRDLVFTVDPASKPGTLVGKVEATDRDMESPNNQVIFILRKGGHGKFGIDVDEGEIFVKNNLTLEPVVDLYELQIEAVDKGVPALTGSTIVTINVPISKPLSVSKSSIFNIAEDATVGAEVGKIDVGDSVDVKFNILDNDVPFNVANGVIQTSRHLDAETVSVYKFEMLVVKPGVPVYTSTTTVTVHIDNINDNPPMFTSQRGYRATVVENQGGDFIDVIPEIKVIDVDNPDITEDVHFSLEGRGADLFRIHPSSAAIRVLNDTGLDAEQALVYNLTIIARDDKGAGLKASAPLSIKVQDVNDHAPSFDYVHNIKIDPRRPIGHEVAKVEARDGDGTPENNRILYFLQDGMGKFRINPLTGSITLSSRLTEEPLRYHYSLLVKAVDSGDPPLSANTTVHITVELNKPPIYDLAQNFHVLENQTSGTKVGHIEAADPDKRGLQFTSLDYSLPLSIDRTTGIIRTTEVLDREKMSHVNLPVQIVDEGSPSYTGTAVATVHILDINDNSPTFGAPDGYHGVVPEVYDSEKPFMMYLNQPITVSDADPDGDISNIQLKIGGQGSEMFDIDLTSGHVILLTPNMIDAEIQPFYNLTIIAIDNTNGRGLSSTIPLLIDVDDYNDHEPEFIGEFAFDVATNVPVGTEVGTLIAKDEDLSERNNKITYILKSGGFGKFQLGSETGVLTLSDNILRDPVLGSYQLVVQALDNGEERLSSETTVTVRVPVNSPPSIKESFHFIIEENMPANSVVGEITLTDPDRHSNPYESFEFSVSDRTAPFEFKTNSGILTTKRALDREMVEYFIVPVSVVNPGAPSYTVSTTVTVNVEDVNDNPAVFGTSTYEATMSENTYTDRLTINQPIVVTDNDATEVNRQVKLKLHGIGSAHFLIDETTGQVKLKSPGQLDAEAEHTYNLTIVALDPSGNGRETTAPLVINIKDLNDHGPVFGEKYTMTIAAGMKVGEIVGTVKATDRDVDRKNNRITYLLRGGAFGKFAIDPDTGNISVLEDLTVEPFRHVYSLQVEAVDSGENRLSAQTTVTVAVNLNKPPVVPKTVQFEVKENQTTGSLVGKLRVTDPDMDYNPEEELEYFSGEPTAPFTVERETGEIRMAGELDREKNDHFEMPVVVVNKGSPSYTATSYVTIALMDVNDNAPSFSAHHYTGSVVEDQHSVPLAQHVELDRLIVVTDEDITEVNRGIIVELRGPGSEKFKLENGELFIYRPGVIDCEVTCQYVLKIHATDQNGKGLTSVADLTIDVKDVNDHSPQFQSTYSFQVNTGAPVGSEVGIIVAKDRDQTTKNNRLTYILIDGGHGKFDVNPSTGELFISDTLKREPYQEVFDLQIQAIDNGVPRRIGETSVTVHVPMNKAPTVNKVVSYSVDENLPAGTIVGGIRVTDPDKDTNDLEAFEFSITDEGVPFEVDWHNGEIILSSSIDRENVESINFTVQVVNDGVPAYTVSTLVTVLINDVNDHPPHFTAKEGYSGSISESVSNEDSAYVKLNQPILVKDEDATTDNQRVTVVLSGTSSDNFILEQDSGKIRIGDPSLIDAEVEIEYKLKLTATDRDGSGLSSTSELIIRVEDENDQSPVFVGNTSFLVEASAHGGSSVGWVQVRDRDATPQNNRVTYLLVEGGHGKFSVDANTGEIKVADSLLREPLLDEYPLSVRAQDNGVPQRSTEATVKVIVPVNHPPKLSRDLFEFSLEENNVIGQVVGTVTASDPDLLRDPNHRLTYSIDDATGTFTINELSGVITAAVILDREVTSEVTFDVEAKDNVYPEYRDVSKVKVIINDVNDNPPILTGGTEYHGSVFEDDKKPIRDQVVKLDRNISIVDRDATVENRDNFVYLEGHTSKFFRYDPASGLISVRNPGTIDREFHGVFDMQIIAQDKENSRLSNSATLRITVADNNDNYPEFLESTFTFTLPSVVNAGDVAGKVVARDIDATEPNNKLIYLLVDNPLGKFKLDINTGDLIILQSFFSKPRKDAYTVKVEARDMGYPSRKTQTNVIIRAPYFDFNEYPPDFQGDTMFVTREEIPVGAVVGRLNVVDADSGKGNNSVRLEMLPTANKVPFAVGADGLITCTDRIDRDHGPNYYTFKVRATDNGSPPFNVTRDISVVVDDINDTPPKFSLGKYKHMVTDSFPPRTVIATPFAFDNVDEKDSVYRYSMKGDQPGYFHIDRKTGVVVTTDTASTLDPQTLNYQVEAVDLYNNTLKATTDLEIQIVVSTTPGNDTCK